MSIKIICDSDSIINYLKYYSFDKNESSIINDKLEEFFLNKVKNEEIIIIDKVHQELKSPETSKFKKNINRYVYSTDH